MVFSKSILSQLLPRQQKSISNPWATMLAEKNRGLQPIHDPERLAECN